GFLPIPLSAPESIFDHESELPEPSKTIFSDCFMPKGCALLAAICLPTLPIRS
ncbi:MAG: hypothetical protein Q9214_006174, partial [Letrouitia sp. 1 TL-2023]